MTRRALAPIAWLLVLGCQSAAPLSEPAPAAKATAFGEGPAPHASFRVIGHRGAAGHAPENTLPALEAARALGVEEVEVDVRLSRDQVPVLFHDARLDRKTNLSGPVADALAETLLQADIGTWFDETHPGAGLTYAGTTPVTLDRALLRFGEAFHFHVELKSESAAAVRLTLEILERRGVRERATLSSFHDEQLRRARRLDPDLPLCLLVRDVENLREAAGPDSELRALFGSGLQERRLDLAVEEGFQMVAFPARDLTPDLVDAAHERDLEIRAWGVRNVADLDRVIQAGADGATLDWPEWALDRRRAAAAP